MKTTMFYYLAPNHIGSITANWNENYGEFHEQIKAHPFVEKYTPLNFQDNFNSDWISDLGYLVIEQE